MDAFEAKWLYFTYKKRRLKLLLDQLMSINKCSIITVPLIAPVGLLFTGYVCAGLRLSKNRLYSPIHGKPIYFDWLDFSYVDCRFSFSFYKLIFLSGVEDNSFLFNCNFFFFAEGGKFESFGWRSLDFWFLSTILEMFRILTWANHVHTERRHVKGLEMFTTFHAREMKEKNEPMVGLVLKEKVLENPLTHPQCVYVELRWSKFLVSSSSVLLCYQLLYGTLGWQMVFDLQTRLGKTLTVLWISDKYV